MKQVFLKDGWRFTWLGEDAPEEFSPDLPGDGIAGPLYGPSTT